MSEQRKPLREWRRAAGLSQMQVAIRTGLSLSAVSNIEAGRNQPRVDVALRLAEAVGATVEQVEWLNNPRPRPKDRPAA